MWPPPASTLLRSEENSVLFVDRGLRVVGATAARMQIFFPFRSFFFWIWKPVNVLPLNELFV
jgi:hypothetical protein